MVLGHLDKYIYDPYLTLYTTSIPEKLYICIWKGKTKFLKDNTVEYPYDLFSWSWVRHKAVVIIEKLNN